MRKVAASAVAPDPEASRLGLPAPERTAAGRGAGSPGSGRGLRGWLRARASMVMVMDGNGVNCFVASENMAIIPFPPNPSSPSDDDSDLLDSL